MSGIDQQILNYAISAFGFIAGFLIHTLWGAVKELRSGHEKLTADVNEVKVLVAGNYPTRTEFDAKITALFAKIDILNANITELHKLSNVFQSGNRGGAHRSYRVRSIDREELISNLISLGDCD